MWLVLFQLPLAIFSSSELLTCPSVGSLTFDLSFEVQNLYGSNEGLAEAAVNLFRNPFIVISGLEVAVVLRAERFGETNWRYYLLGVYYCGQYRVVPATPSVDLSDGVSQDLRAQALEQITDFDTEILRELVFEHSSDDILTRGKLLPDNPLDMSYLLASAIQRDRRAAIQRHLQDRPPALFVVEGQIKCGLTDFWIANSYYRLLREPGDVSPTFEQLNRLDLLGLCFVLPEVLSRMPLDMILRRDTGASVFEEDEDVTLSCPGPYGRLVNQVSSTHDTPRGLQLKEAVRGDLQRAGVYRKTELPSFSFAAFCADRYGVPSWISGNAPDINKVQAVSNRDWAKLLVKKLPELQTPYGEKNSAIRTLLAQKTVSVSETFDAVAESNMCVPVENLQFQSVWTVSNWEINNHQQAKSLLVTGVDVGLLFRSNDWNAKLVGVWYCGRFFEATGELDLTLPNFSDMHAFVIKQELRDLLITLVAATVTERLDVNVQSYVRHKKERGAPYKLFDSHHHAMFKYMRELTNPAVKCNAAFYLVPNTVYLAKRLKTSDLDLQAICALGIDMMRNHGAAVTAVETGGDVSYGVTCPNGTLVPKDSPRMNQISEILAAKGQVFFVQMCQDKSGIPSWLSSDVPASARYPRDKRDAELAELLQPIGSLRKL